MMNEAKLARIVSACRHKEITHLMDYKNEDFVKAIMKLADKVDALSEELKEERETVAELKSRLVEKK